MIRLRVVEGDLLESRAQAIMLPVDGMLPAGADAPRIARSLGRLAREFARRHPACELIEEIEAQVAFPLALGRAAEVELPAGSPFRFALLLSMLAHQGEATGEEALRAAAGGALGQALALCDRLGVPSVAMPLLKGGWRISTAVAMTVMLNVLAGARVRHVLAVEVRVVDEGAAMRMRELARSLGLTEA